MAWQRGGAEHVARAKRAVILCAGAIGSPLLLQRSGVGDPERLRELGIEARVDRPAVGAHLQDHLCIDHVYRARVPTLNDELGPWPAKPEGRPALPRAAPRPARAVGQPGRRLRGAARGTRAPGTQLYFSPLSYTRTPPGVRR